jgi:hypothetical protein
LRVELPDSAIVSDEKFARNCEGKQAREGRVDAARARNEGGVSASRGDGANDGDTLLTHVLEALLHDEAGTVGKEDLAIRPLRHGDG